MLLHVITMAYITTKENKENEKNAISTDSRYTAPIPGHFRNG